MRYYPIYLDINGKRCIVLGGGRIAERKVKSLLKCGADVTVISPDLAPPLNTLLSKGRIRHIQRDYQEGDLEGAFLVIGATNDSLAHEKASQEAQKCGILINIVDTPDRCNFIVPSVVERDDLVIAISTNGKSPALARRIREELESVYGREYGVFLALLGAVREKLLKTSNDSERNKRLFYEIIDSEMIHSIKEKKHQEINEILEVTLGEGYSLEELNIIL
ncbi:MAG: bifunctional precorrin-2 dehydrogenase/sirohydrochlorin ferrochelatase [Thermodesulfobacteriota bacterium]|nr:bifunctional precorrin-2 dehydrogenase/sirohydrochlorin ferrochelatase [Thermodesulfobacteriota bacterium]